MLTRFRIQRDFRVFVRYLSDIPSDNDGKAPESKATTPDSQKSQKSSSESATEKIQALLKSMMAEPKISDSEYREKFTVAPERKRKQTHDVNVKTEKIDEHITKAAGEVAQAIGGNVKQTEAELLSKVLGKINQTSTSLSDLLVGMKVDRSSDSEDLGRETRGQQVKRIVNRTQLDTRKTRFAERRSSQARSDLDESKGLPRIDRTRAPLQPTTVNIFGGQPLGIFKAKGTNYGTSLEIWDSLKQREITLATSQPPANYFQKMIQWTNQGKVWTFPINNEQGMEEEQNIHFSEHIFLESHLEGWCPTRGPIRHFMELVCVGLSKNAFYTVKEKKDHIMWYKEYFESKKDVLTEVGAWNIQNMSDVEKSS